MAQAGNQPEYEKVLLPTYAPADPVFERGSGAEIFDDEGKRYIDLAAGIATTSLGHASAELVGALTAQAGRLMHVSNCFRNPTTASTAARLLELTGMERIFFANSGAESNECALKCARKRGYALSPEKFGVISFVGSFHGRIGMSLAASGQPKLWEGHGPQSPGFRHLDLGDEAALRAASDERLCAIIVEPILGEGGVIEVEREFLALARELCDQHDALLIFDEIQTGCGRTGSMFRCQALDIKPDLLTMAKGLGGGFPVGAAAAGPRAATAFGVGDHGTTFGGNPLAAAAVAAVMDIVSDDDFLAAVRSKGERVMSFLTELASRPASPISEIRGQGLMIGIKLNPGAMTAASAVAAGIEAGVLTVAAADNVVRLLPALNIDDELLDEGLNLLAQALS